MLEPKVAIWWKELSEEEQHLLITFLNEIDLCEFGIVISSDGKYVKE